MIESNLSWSDDYIIGESQIDTHHKLFFEITNDIKECIEAGCTDFDTFEVVDFFHRYTDMHFSVEEEIMEKLNFPCIEDHKKSHEEFLMQITSLANSLKAQSNKSNLYELFNLIKRWIVNHITVEDIKLKEYISLKDDL